MMESGYLFRAVIVCLGTGTLLGFLFLACKILRLAFHIGKIGAFFIDLFFCAAAAVIVFLVALAMENGRLRFFQVALQLIGGLAVLTALDPFVEHISNKVHIICKKIHRYMKGKMNLFIQKKKKTKKQKHKQNKKLIKVNKKLKKNQKKGKKA